MFCGPPLRVLAARFCVFLFIYSRLPVRGCDSAHARHWRLNPSPRPTYPSSKIMPEQDALNQQLQQAHPSPIVGVIGLLFVVLMLVSMWKVFTKGGEPG